MNSRLRLLLPPALFLAAAISGPLRAADMAEAERLARQGKTAEARMLFEEELRANPKSAIAHAGLGFVALNERRLDDALKLAQDFQQHDARQGAMFEASVYERQKKWDEAEAALRRVLELDPASNWAKDRLGLAIIRSGDANRAFAWFEDLAAQEPDNARWKFQIARTAQLTGQRIDDGIAAAEAYLAVPHARNTPSHASAQWVLGQLQEKRGDKAAARAAYEAALKSEPDHRGAAEALKKLK